jgi:hypothetical protein
MSYRYLSSSEIDRAAGVHPNTVRLYETWGFLPPVPRSPSGYRQFTETHLLAFTALVFWSPGVLFTWIFDGVFQLARYPLALYPGWLRLALTGSLPPGGLAGGAALSAALIAAASTFFRMALWRYASASS